MRPQPRSARPLPLALCALVAALAAPLAGAGGSGESALIVVDPSSAESLYLANRYRHARQVPAANVLLMEAGAAGYGAWVAENQAGFLGTLSGRRIEHVDYVVVMPGPSFFVPAAGLVSDGCSPVNRFSVAAPFTLAFNSGAILSGTTSARVNRYYGTDDAALAFDSQTTWLGGVPSAAGNAERYFIGAMLGYTGLRGNTLPELLDLIDRSVAVDGTHPAGTFYFMQTGDVLRSSPRHGWYPAVTASIVALGGLAQHLFADLPVGQLDCQGIMTGLANPVIVGGGFDVLPGAFCDHLTSYAGTFDNGAQTKMSEWISAGASATAGTVEEPCNYPGKFPHARLHLWAFQGLSLGEAWLRSVRYYPFQNLLYGDPLTRPYATIPTVDVADAPTGPVSGTVLLTPSVPAPVFPVEDLELYVDGVLVRTGQLGDALPLASELLSDGWHELRVLGYDTTPVRSVGRWIGAVTVDNQGRSATVGASAPAGDLDSVFDFTLESPGGAPVELRLVSAGRVLAATTSNPGAVAVSGQNLGAGPVEVQAEALFADGARVRSAPLALTIAYVDAAAAAVQPVAYSYTKRVPVDGATVVELPALFDDAPADVTFAVTAAPAQATLGSGTARGYRIVRPNPGASGSDTLAFTASSPSGTSADGVVTLVYEPVAACPAPANYCPLSPNSNGPGATILAAGSTSVVANDLVLSVYGAAASQLGIFYYGPEQLQVPFGDGFRCVGGGALGTFRLPVVTTDPFGDAEFPLDLNDPPMVAGPGAIAPGDDWNFQFWFRDPLAGGATFNLSDALAVTFCP